MIKLKRIIIIIRKVLKSVNNEQSSLTQFIKDNKLLNQYDNKQFEKSPKPIRKHEQVIPTQFQYP